MTLVKGEERVRAEGRVFWRWSPNPEIRVDLDKPNTSEKFDLTGFSLQIPNYSATIDVTWFRRTASDLTNNRGCLASLIPINLFSSDLPSQTSSHVGRLSTAKLSSGSKVRTILFHIVNFRDFTGRAILQNNHWEITIDRVENFEHLEKQVKEVGGHFISHVGRIRRIDNVDFDPEDILCPAYDSDENSSDLWSGLHYFLSFTRGLWSPPILPVGLDQYGNHVWQLWECPIVDRWRNDMQGWFNMDHQTLRDLFPGFWELWTCPTCHATISQAIFWHVESSKLVASTGGSIILQQAALESLAWLKLVNIDGTYSNNFYDSNRKIAEVNISELLKECGSIQNCIPNELADLLNYATSTGKTTGAGIISAIRNNLTHGKPSRLKRLHSVARQDKTIFEAWRLGKQYLELVLLYLFKYNGYYRNWILRRYAKQDRGEPVPWQITTD
ncbi:MAG: hypothetical protein HC924_17975 [Synechococcaceae cyanobacterium SM2_3_2]|nr:hypothetical protein [Synechococcaceae cyanobacterium SM2_3_2]